MDVRLSATFLRTSSIGEFNGHGFDSCFGGLDHAPYKDHDRSRLPGPTTIDVFALRATTFGDVLCAQPTIQREKVTTCPERGKEYEMFQKQ